MSTIPSGKLPSDLPAVGAQLGISEASAAWLVAATDPFHDVSFKLHGYPDLCSSNSYIIAEKSTVQVDAPAAVTWDCHIRLDSQIMYQASTKAATLENTNNTLTVGGTSYPTGHCVITKVLSGQTTFPNTDEKWAPTNVNQSAYPTANNNFGGAGVRLIGAGVECVNVSAPIYAQGSVISYRVSSQLQPSYVTHLAAVKPAILSVNPPQTAEQAMRIPNAKQWEAKKGAYCVQLMNNEHNPFKTSRLNFLFQGDNYNAGGGAAPGFTNVEDLSLQVPFDQVGAYFTNLSPQSVLKVTVVRYLEITPNATNSNISLCSSSAAYDEKVLQIYGKMISILPPATFISDNAGGDWFRGIVKLAKEVIPTVVKGLDVVTGSYLPSTIYRGLQSLAGPRSKPFSSPPTSGVETRSSVASMIKQSPARMNTTNNNKNNKNRGQGFGRGRGRRRR